MNININITFFINFELLCLFVELKLILCHYKNTDKFIFI